MKKKFLSAILLFLILKSSELICFRPTQDNIGKKFVTVWKSKVYILFKVYNNGLQLWTQYMYENKIISNLVITIERKTEVTFVWEYMADNDKNINHSLHVCL